ncbi:MAG: PQQ-binding-like beta-propeller repeat protein [Planctomycetota bacterium]
MSRSVIPSALLAATVLLASGWGSSDAREASRPQDRGGVAAMDDDAPEPAPGRATWPLFRGDPSLSGIADTTLPADLDLAWTYEAGGAITSSPVVAAGLVVFGSDDQKVHCANAKTGEPVWAFETEDLVEAPALIADGTVFIGSNDTFFYALDAATGELKWKAPTLDKILGGANIVRTDERTIVVVGSYDANLYGFDATTGEQLWVYETDNYVNGTPAIHEGRAIFGGCDAVLHVVDVTTGKRATAVEIGGECHIAGSAAFVDGRAYFGHYGNQFVCVDVAKGEVVWAYDSPRQAFFSSPSVTADRVVFGGRDRHLHCARRSDGEPQWKFKTRRKVDSSPVVAGDAVVFGSGDGRMYVLGLEDGEERWTYDIGEPVLSSPAVVGGRVYVGANDGQLYCFSAAGETEKGESR